VKFQEKLSKKAFFVKGLTCLIANQGGANKKISIESKPLATFRA